MYLSSYWLNTSQSKKNQNYQKIITKQNEKTPPTNQPNKLTTKKP